MFYTKKKQNAYFHRFVVMEYTFFRQKVGFINFIIVVLVRYEIGQECKGIQLNGTIVVNGKIWEKKYQSMFCG